MLRSVSNFVRVIAVLVVVLVATSLIAFVNIWFSSPLREPVQGQVRADAESANGRDAAVPYYALELTVLSVDALRESAVLSVLPREDDGGKAAGVTISNWTTTRTVRFEFDGAVQSGPQSGAVLRPGAHEPYVMQVHAVPADDRYPYRSISKYPADTYPFVFRASGHYLTDAGEWAPLRLSVIILRSVDSGFESAILGAAVQDDSPSTVILGLGLSRPKTIFMFAVLVMTVILAMVGLIVVMTYRIVTTSSRQEADGSRPARPPVMQGLVWAAALTFTAIQIRDNYPGSPPIGIAADFAVVVPALLGSVAVAAVLLHEWLNRQDFDTTGSKGNIE